MALSTTLPDETFAAAEGSADAPTAHCADKIRVHTFLTLEEIEGLRPIWEKWQLHPNSDIDAYLTVLSALPGEVKPIVFLLCRNGLPQAMLVGRVEASDLPLRIGYKDLVRVAARKLVFIYGGFLGIMNPENCAAIIGQVKNSLQDGIAELAFFNSVPTDSALYTEAHREQSIFLRDLAPSFEIHRSMVLPESAGEIESSISSKIRKNKSWKNLRKDFPERFTVRCFSNPDEMDQMFREAESVASKTYQRGLGVGFADNALMRARLGLEAKHGRLRCYILYLGGEPCAFWVGKLYGETFHSDSMGYDPAFAKYSPGMFLVMNVIEVLCKNERSGPVRTVDFGLGDAEYKRKLGDKEWEEASFYLFASSLRGIYLYLLHSPAGLANRVAKQFLARVTLLQKVKRLWRNRVMTKANKT